MKKILMISFRFPYPLTDGSRIRVYNMAKILSERYWVDLLAISDRSAEDEQQKYLEDLEKIFKKVVVFNHSSLICKLNAAKGFLSGLPFQTQYHYFPGVQKWIDEHQGDYDLIWCHHIRMANYLKKVRIPKVIDFVDATSLNYKENQRRAYGIWKLFLSIESQRTLKYEHQQLHDFGKAFITSPYDKDWLEKSQRSNDRLILLPNGVSEEILCRKKRFAEEDWVVFLGRMKYAPNVDAAIYFAKEVFPFLRREVPNLKFLIVGIAPASRILELRRMDGIEVTGFVEDPWEYLERAKVVVVPLRFSGGIQNKALEAMALSRAVVITPNAARGIEGENGKHFMVAQDSTQMVSQILTLLRNKDLREKIGENGRRLIKQTYRWNVVGERLLKEIKEVLHEKEDRP